MQLCGKRQVDTLVTLVTIFLLHPLYLLFSVDVTYKMKLHFWSRATHQTSTISTQQTLYLKTKLHSLFCVYSPFPSNLPPLHKTATTMSIKLLCTLKWHKHRLPSLLHHSSSFIFSPCSISTSCFPYFFCFFLLHAVYVVYLSSNLTIFILVLSLNG